MKKCTCDMMNNTFLEHNDIRKQKGGVKKGHYSPGFNLPMTSFLSPQINADCKPFSLITNWLNFLLQYIHVLSKRDGEIQLQQPVKESFILHCLFSQNHCGSLCNLLLQKRISGCQLSMKQIQRIKFLLTYLAIHPIFRVFHCQKSEIFFVFFGLFLTSSSSFQYSHSSTIEHKISRNRCLSAICSRMQTTLHISTLQ